MQAKILCKQAWVWSPEGYYKATIAVGWTNVPSLLTFRDVARIHLEEVGAGRMLVAYIRRGSKCVEMDSDANFWRWASMVMKVGDRCNGGHILTR